MIEYFKSINLLKSELKEQLYLYYLSKDEKYLKIVKTIDKRINHFMDLASKEMPTQVIKDTLTNSHE